MKDILGRELKDGDLCIGMAIGRNSSGMHIGIFKGQSVVRLGWMEKSLSKSSARNIYLIENPTEQELVIKEKISKMLEEEVNERARKASLETIPLKELEVGGVYKDAHECRYVYLGKRKVIFEDIGRCTKSEEEGHCFAYVYNMDVYGVLQIYGNSINKHNVKVLKGGKKLTEMVENIDLEFPMVKTHKSNYPWPEDYKLTIE